MSRIDNIKQLKENKIFVFDNFISKELCNKILFSLDNGLWMESKVISRQKNGYIEHESPIRTSKTIFEFLFSFELKKIIEKVQRKIISTIKTEADKIEGWQITKYGFEEKFEFHLDCCGFINQDPEGDRDKTIILYLHSPEEGGETFFRAHNLYVRPKQGRLIVWDNLLPDGNCNHAMMHAGLPVKKGVKIILNTWIRQFSTIKTNQHESTRKSHQGHY